MRFSVKEASRTDDNDYKYKLEFADCSFNEARFIGGFNKAIINLYYQLEGKSGLYSLVSSISCSELTKIRYARFTLLATHNPRTALLGIKRLNMPENNFYKFLDDFICPLDAFLSLTARTKSPQPLGKQLDLFQTG